LDLKKEKRSKRVGRSEEKHGSGEREYIQCSNHGGDKHPKEGARRRS